MCDAILELLAQYSGSHSLAGIGVGSPGPLELPADAFIIRPIFPDGTGFTYWAKWKGAFACRLLWRATPMLQCSRNIHSASEWSLVSIHCAC